jgi:hypothetical protein
MIPDLFEQLAQSEAPPPPPQFNRQLHERINRSLLATQLADLVFGALPWALAEFLRALGGFFYLTVIGKFPTSRGNNPDRKSL